MPFVFDYDKDNDNDYDKNNDDVQYIIHSRFPCCVFHHICLWYLSWNTADKYKYKILKLDVSWVGNQLMMITTKCWWQLISRCTCRDSAFSGWAAFKLLIRKCQPSLAARHKYKIQIQFMKYITFLFEHWKDHRAIDVFGPKNGASLFLWCLSLFPCLHLRRNATRNVCGIYILHFIQTFCNLERDLLP